jgi:branched-chain amino acid transport system ATP-binding protein
MNDWILHVEGLRKHFGGIAAVDGCDLAVADGSITGLIGPNGAGKTTLFNLVVGLYLPETGRIVFRGNPIHGLAPWEIVARGVVKTFQIPRELRNLTVLENVMVAATGQPGERPLTALLGLRKAWAFERQVERRAWDVLRTVELEHLAEEMASNLSGGQKKLLELGRALMVNPRMILLDEPVAGVNPTLTQRLLSILEDLRRDEGKTFFLIEHDMDVVTQSCDRVIVMHQGRRIAEGTPEEVKADPVVIESYLGG